MLHVSVYTITRGACKTYGWNNHVEELIERS